MTAPVLTLLEPHKPFVVYSDASKAGLGLVFALKIWRHYLYAKKCEVFTYHKSLKYMFKHKNLNMRQRRWLELISDYQCDIKYHPRKANVVVVALSRKSISEDLYILSLEVNSLLCSMRKLLIENRSQQVILTAVQEFIPLDWEELKDRQKKDSKLAEVIGKIEKSEGLMDFSIREDGTLYYKNRRVIPYEDVPGSEAAFLVGRNEEGLAEFVNKCSVCRLVKEEHQKPADSLERRMKIYIAEIVRLDGVPKTIVSDRDPRFMSRFWQSL
ncbi:uncharacterized protein LOC122310209 [Carya illinoinensis]|uniref:uncharacterized protein LOC122310209 n=1 Tax=Carya illinoinensis TaxID=32201 RepID=UPI001C721B51|nr:uncharacterized protein LOC122310209 [Carya illinoinensis]